MQIDAVTSLASGALWCLAAERLAALTELPAGLIFYSGLSLFPIGLYMLFVGGQRPPHSGLALSIILGNFAWVAASLYLLAGGISKPNGLGVAFVLAQAGTVALLAVIESLGLRRLT